MPNSPHRPPEDANDPRFIIVEAAPAMLWLGDEQGNCVYMNRELREFWGLRPDLRDFSWDRTLHPDDADHLFAAHVAAMKAQTTFEVEARYRRADGQWRLLHTSARPRFSSNGTFLGMVGLNSDVTDQRAAKTQLDLLARELEHRIKNIFSVVGGMARLSAREAPTAVEAFETFQGRIAAMAAAYAQVVPTGDLTTKAGTLLSLFDRLFAPFNGPNSANVEVQGPDFPLSTKAASNLALIFHELATNAAKYGALAGCGSVILTIEELADKQVRFTWQENVVDRVVVEPESPGFGSQVLQLASANFGTAPIKTWRPDGLRWQMTVAKDRLTNL